MEYKVFQLKGVRAIENALNDLGEDGWRVDTITLIEKDFYNEPTILVVFYRAKK